jgi:GNAT superfamily N-acetyltransferase
MGATTPATHSSRCQGKDSADTILKPAPKRSSRTASRKGFEFIADVNPHSVETQASERLQTYLESVKELWKDPTVQFGSNCADLLSRKTEMKLTILVRSESSSDDAQGGKSTSSLVGFLVYNVHPKKKYMSIRRLAIAPEYRQQGHASLFMNWCIRQPNVSYLAATSLPDAVGFYRAYGFRKVETWHTGGTAQPDDEPKSNQVYMEYRPGRCKGRQRKTCK